MGTPNDGIRVIAKDGLVLTVRVRCIDENIEEPATERDADFFVRALCEESDHPRALEPVLPQRITRDGGDLDDHAWLVAQAKQYISTVE